MIDNDHTTGAEPSSLTRMDQATMLSGKHIVFILPPRQFRDEEYAVPKQLLERLGARVTVASSRLGPITGMLGATVTPDITVECIDSQSVDALLLVGGVGSRALWHNSIVHCKAKEANDAKRVVSAICLAPVTLANAGLLNGKRATAYPSAQGFLEWKGATFTGNPVEIDGTIVTANGPEAAREFAETVARVIVQNNTLHNLPNNYAMQEIA